MSTKGWSADAVAAQLAKFAPAARTVQVAGPSAARTPAARAAPQTPRAVVVPRNPPALRGGQEAAVVEPFDPAPPERPRTFSFDMAGVPVSQNAAYRMAVLTIGGKRVRRMIKSDLAADWQDDLALAALAHRPDDWRTDGWFSLTISYQFATTQSDCDGPTKLVMDALQGVVYVNDRQVLDVRATKDPISGPGFVRVTATRLRDADKPPRKKRAAK